MSANQFMLTAIETTGKLNAPHQLELDADLPENTPERVRVIVLFEDDVRDISEDEWLRAASANPAFDFLKDEAEDIYTLEDGRAVADEE